MLLVGWLCGHPESKPDDQRTEDIERRLHAIGNEDVAVAEHAGDDLDDGEKKINGDAEKREALPCAVGVSGVERFCRFCHGTAS
jgi:hypothetical protein